MNNLQYTLIADTCGSDRKRLVQKHSMTLSLLSQKPRRCVIWNEYLFLGIDVHDLRVLNLVKTLQFTDKLSDFYGEKQTRIRTDMTIVFCSTRQYYRAQYNQL